MQRRYSRVRWFIYILRSMLTLLDPIEMVLHNPILCLLIDTHLEICLYNSLHQKVRIHVMLCIISWTDVDSPQWAWVKRSWYRPLFIRILALTHSLRLPNPMPNHLANVKSDWTMPFDLSQWSPGPQGDHVRHWLLPQRRFWRNGQRNCNDVANPAQSKPSSGTARIAQTLMPRSTTIPKAWWMLSSLHMAR